MLSSNAQMCIHTYENVNEREWGGRVNVIQVYKNNVIQVWAKGCPEEGNDEQAKKGMSEEGKGMTKKRNEWTEGSEQGK